MSRAPPLKNDFLAENPPLSSASSCDLRRVEKVTITTATFTNNPVGRHIIKVEGVEGLSRGVARSGAAGAGLALCGRKMDLFSSTTADSSNKAVQQSLLLVV